MGRSFGLVRVSVHVRTVGNLMPDTLMLGFFERRRTF